MLVAAKTYALISEYALICDMRLITREYGITMIFFLFSEFTTPGFRDVIMLVWNVHCFKAFKILREKLDFLNQNTGNNNDHDISFSFLILIDVGVMLKRFFVLE